MPKGVWRVVSEGSSSGQFGPKWALAVLHAVLPLVSNQGLGQFSVTVRVMGRSRGVLCPVDLGLQVTAQGSLTG